MYDPTIGLYGTHLFLPKKVGKNWSPVKTALTFYSGDKCFTGWDDCGSHLRVPREYLTEEECHDMGFNVRPIGPSSFHSVIMNPTFSLREHQGPALEAMRTKGNGIISLACGRGKTVIALHAACLLKYPTFIVVPTIDLAYQWKQRILEHTDLEEHEIGWAQGHPSKWNWCKPLVVGVLKSVGKAAKEDTIPPEVRAHFGTWIYDECHRLSAAEFHHAAGIGFGRRWGLSATPFRSDGNDSLFKAHIGPVLYSDTDQPNAAKIYFLQTQKSLTAREENSVLMRNGDINTAKLCSTILGDELRISLAERVIKRLLALGRNILILSERVSVSAELAGRFPNSGWITGKVKGDKRMGELEKNPVFATRSLAKEGIDKKSLNTVLILYPFTDRANYIQIVGRAQRSENPMIIFMEDDVPICRAMCKTLRNHSIDEGYAYHSIGSEHELL